MLLPCGFGGGIVGGQLGAWGDFQAACVWQLDFALFVYGKRQLRLAGVLRLCIGFQAACNAPIGRISNCTLARSTSFLAV